MKTNYLLLLFVVSLFMSCAQEETSFFKISPDDKISISAAPAAPIHTMRIAELNSVHLSPLEIVKQTTRMSLSNTINGILYANMGYSFGDEQRDTLSSTPRLLMWATSLISLTGELQTGFVGNFLEAEDVLYIRNINGNVNILDTIAYTPNSVIREAALKITNAYKANDIDSCYTLFNSAYNFIPITGKEWRDLKGLNQQ